LTGASRQTTTVRLTKTQKDGKRGKKGREDKAGAKEKGNVTGNIDGTPGAKGERNGQKKKRTKSL